MMSGPFLLKAGNDSREHEEQVDLENLKGVVNYPSSHTCCRGFFVTAKHSR